MADEKLYTTFKRWGRNAFSCQNTSPRIFISINVNKSRVYKDKEVLIFSTCFVASISLFKFFFDFSVVIVFCPQEKTKEIVPIPKINEKTLESAMLVILIVPMFHLQSVSQPVVNKARMIIRNCFYRVVSLFVSVSPFVVVLPLMDETALLMLLPTQRPGFMSTLAMLALYSTGFITELKGSRVIEKTGYHSAALITSP